MCEVELSPSRAPSRDHEFEPMRGGWCTWVVIPTAMMFAQCDSAVQRQKAREIETRKRSTHSFRLSQDESEVVGQYRL